MPPPFLSPSLEPGRLVFSWRAAGRRDSLPPKLFSLSLFERSEPRRTVAPVLFEDIRRPWTNSTAGWGDRVRPGLKMQKKLSAVSDQMVVRPFRKTKTTSTRNFRVAQWIIHSEDEIEAARAFQALLCEDCEQKDEHKNT